MNIIECYPPNWDHNQTLPTMQSQRFLDWGILDSQLKDNYEDSMNVRIHG